MTRNLLSKKLLLAIAAVLSLPAAQAAAQNAGATPLWNVPEINTDEYEHVVLPNGSEYYNLKSIKAPESNGPKHKVTFKYDLTDETGKTAASLTFSGVYDKVGNQVQVAHIKNGDTASVFLPTGIYDSYNVMNMTTAYSVSHKIGMNAFDIVENINVTGDTTVRVSFSDCKNRIDVTPVYPNGETAYGGVYAYDKKQYTTNGNFLNCYALVMMRNGNGDKLISTYVTDRVDYNVTMNGTVRQYKDVSYLVSDASKSCVVDVLTEFIPYYNDKLPVTIAFSKSGFSGNSTLKNRADQFVTVPLQYKRSVLGQSYKGVNVVGIGSYMVTTGAQISHQTGSDYENGIATRNFAAAAVFDGSPAAFTRFKFRPSELDYGGKVDSTATSPKAYLTTAPNYSLVDGKPYTADFDPHLNYAVDKTAGMLGNNVPLTVANFRNYIDDKGMRSIYTSYTFRGRYGETVDTHKDFLQHTQCTADGISDSYNGSINGLLKFITTRLDSLTGNVQLSITNDNVTVDDLKGLNTCEYAFNVTRNDFTPPTVTYLQLRDGKTGNITDRFNSNAKDDLLGLTAGDFGYNAKSYGYELGALDTLKVSYSPNGKNQWKKLAVNATGESTSANGYYYEGNLADVVEKSDNKWYDLKIEATDLAGNTMVQTLAPAFRLENIIPNSGINDVSSEKAVRSVVYYNLLGNASTQPFEGVNIKVTRYADGSQQSAKVLK